MEKKKSIKEKNEERTIKFVVTIQKFIGSDEKPKEELASAFVIDGLLEKGKQQMELIVGMEKVCEDAFKLL